MNDGKIGLSNLKIITEDGRELEVGKCENVSIDFAKEESDYNLDSIMCISSGEVSFDISDNIIKKYHRKRKGNRYLIYYTEEYRLFDDFIYKVFNRKLKYKKYKKVGESNG